MTSLVHSSMDGEVYFIRSFDATRTLALGASVKLGKDAVQFFMYSLILWERPVQAPGMHLVQRVHTYNDLEFCNAELDAYLYGKGILQEIATPYTSQQNGRIKRFMQTAMTLVRAMLACANSKAHFCAYAANMYNWTVQSRSKKQWYRQIYGSAVPDV